MEKTVICPICNQSWAHLAQHLQKRHRDEYSRNEQLCVTLYRSGLTVERIAAHPDVVFNNKMTVNRVLRRFLDPTIIEQARRERAASTLSRQGRVRKVLKEAQAISTQSATGGSVLSALSQLVALNSEHINYLRQFAEDVGFELNLNTGVLSSGPMQILVIPNSKLYSEYKLLALDFYASMPEGHRSLIIFLDELIEKRELIKSMIVAKSGGADLVRVAARKCEIVALHSRVAKTFFNQNHISGHVLGELYLGLQYNGEVVSAISMRRPFTNKYPNTIEIARFAVKSGCAVQGGFSRLLSAVKDRLDARYSKILSYCDLRYGNGNVYNVAGFSEVGCTKPDYCYTDGTSRYHRFKYRASGATSEREVAELAGVHRMYGVGSKIFELPLC
jgi:hypothetical protein